MAAPETYSRTQIFLHWAIALLVGFQIVFHEGMEDLWRARMRGDIANVPTPTLHSIIGLIILALVIWRLVLRIRRGVPPAPANEHPVLSLVATITHWAFYALLILMVTSGSTAWFLGLEAPAEAHGAIEKLLLALIALHIAAALVHHFVWRTNVLKRMLGMA